MAENADKGLVEVDSSSRVRYFVTAIRSLLVDTYLAGNGNKGVLEDPFSLDRRLRDKHLD